MSSKGFQGIKQQAEGAAQDAANALGQAAQDAVNQATNTSQKAMDYVCKTAQDGAEKATAQATEAMSAFGKKCSFKK
ncbi:adipogenesis regulatory factor [Alligator mississippiensis]|uniref:Adipogenesis regulatory factor n=1 Tax=Alligator mississippiensis TaxID=8496 RepID=A0A151MTB9_ALLMI|nr:adipogenesis regulatory factor [Alligator mississippiensis]KYO27747.1 adipogenesis regulatory factor [Alligator mississippiensis]